MCRAAAVGDAILSSAAVATGEALHSTNVHRRPDTPIVATGGAGNLLVGAGSWYRNYMGEAGRERRGRHESEKRQTPDRRRRATPMLSRYVIRGRRRAARRADEQERIYVDRPGPWVIAAGVILVGLSLVDAYITLGILSEGGEEINPLMRAVLNLGTGSFLSVKVGLTGLGAVLLCLHKTWSVGRICLGVALGGYAALAVYHLVVQTMRGWTG